MILGIDPGGISPKGIRTGAACILDDKGALYLIILINTHDFQELRDLAIDFKGLGGLTCYVEKCYMPVTRSAGKFKAGKTFNPKTLIDHAMSIGLTKGVMESHGVQCHLVGATTWQSQVRVINGNRQPKKEGSLAVAKLLGYETKNHNEADAMLIATYGYRQRKIK